MFFENGIRQNLIMFNQWVFCLLFCESGSAHTSVAISRQIPTRQKGECEFSAATKFLSNIRGGLNFDYRQPKIRPLKA